MKRVWSLLLLGLCLSGFAWSGGGGYYGRSGRPFYGPPPFRLGPHWPGPVHPPAWAPVGPLPAQVSWFGVNAPPVPFPIGFWCQNQGHTPITLSRLAGDTWVTLEMLPNSWVLVQEPMWATANSPSLVPVYCQEGEVP